MKRRARPTPLAVVDLGSNAVRLQIADAARDGSFTVRAEDRSSVRLGAQVFRTGRLSSDAIVVHLDTDHSRRPVAVLADIPSIHDFVL